MSFSYNPFNHVELLHKGDGLWTWYCHSCGGEGKTPLHLNYTSVIIASFKRHIWSSHKRLEEDFKDWSDY